MTKLAMELRKPKDLAEALGLCPIAALKAKRTWSRKKLGSILRIRFEYSSLLQST